MSLYSDRLWIGLSFVFAYLAMHLFPIFWPAARCLFFAPFLILLYYKRSLFYCVWASFGCGLLMDLLSVRERLGVNAVIYCLTTAILYAQKQHFFQDKLFTLPFMTTLFSLLASLFSVAAVFVSTSTAFLFSWHWALTDFFLLPLIDALFALALFSLPAYMLRRRATTRDNTLSLQRA